MERTEFLVDVEGGVNDTRSVYLLQPSKESTAIASESSYVAIAREEERGCSGRKVLGCDRGSRLLQYEFAWLVSSLVR